MTMEKYITMKPDTPLFTEQEELRGLSRSVAEIEWLMLIVVMFYYVFGDIDSENKPYLALALVIYGLFIMGFRYAGFFKQESRWKLAVETWAMTGFITLALWYTGRLESPLVNSYSLVIITSALALGKLTTLFELALIAACFVFLGTYSTVQEFLSLKYAGYIFTQFAPLVLVAYITTMLASDIRYCLNKIKLVSETDELTGIFNRRGFVIIADRLIDQAVRYNRNLSLLIIDSDNLKQVNDRHGHQSGDNLLMTLAKTIRTQLRQSDVFARHGGDEFVVLLPETSAEGAFEVAERIRGAIANTPLVAVGGLLNSTVSIGVASYPADGNNLTQLFAHADSNLYVAKLGGRNRVIQSLA